jgi:hypothetical protein
MEKPLIAPQHHSFLHWWGCYQWCCQEGSLVALQCLSWSAASVWVPPHSSSLKWFWGDCGTRWWRWSYWYARVTAALNTNLEGASAELDRYHEELQNAQARIAQLEAQLLGQQPPEKASRTTPLPLHQARSFVTTYQKLQPVWARILRWLPLLFMFR